MAVEVGADTSAMLSNGQSWTNKLSWSLVTYHQGQKIPIFYNANGFVLCDCSDAKYSFEKEYLNANALKKHMFSKNHDLLEFQANFVSLYNNIK